MMKTISILGSTGSIGRQSLDIIDNLNISVCALTAGTNVQRMAEQCRKYRTSGMPQQQYHGAWTCNHVTTDKGQSPDAP